jgi:hypothetical protein
MHDREQQRKMDANLRDITEDMRVCRKEMKANREAAEACLESMEPTSLEMSPSQSIRKSLKKMPQSILSEH